MENNGQDNGKNYTFVQEKVKSKRARKVRKVLTWFVLVLVFAVVFGFVARIVFIKSDETVARWLGVDISKDEGVKRNEVKLPSPTSSDKPDSPTQKPSATPTPTPKPTEEPAEKPEGKGTKKAEGSLEAYVTMMKQIKDVSAKVGKSLVTINAVKSEINWLDENVVTEQKQSGIIMGDNGVELLILANYDKVRNADTITVDISANITTEATVFNYDSDYNLAILAVKLKELPDYVLSEVNTATLGASMSLTAGTPIIALGSPNGYNGSIEYGFVTAVGDAAYVTDGKADLFYTDITNSDNSDGLIVNLEGQLVGLITTKLSSDNQVNASTAVGISSLEKQILKLLNNSERAYLGIKAEDIPTEDLMRLDIMNGIYVSDVVEDSPAALAGIKKGDIITEIAVAGTEEPAVIRSVSGYMAALAQFAVGDTVTISVYRNSAQEEKNITLEAVVGSKQ